MGYVSPPEFVVLKQIRITNFRSEKNCVEKTVEMLFLGQGEWFGYYNKIGAKKRILAAFVQTFWAVLAVVGLAWGLGLFMPESDDMKSSMVGILVAVFGATLWREMKDIYGKWDYLAKVFNDVVKTPPLKVRSHQGVLNGGMYSIREHLAACLAYDILTMNMWAHRSFRKFFAEMLEKAIADKYMEQPHIVIDTLSSIAKDGIAFSEASGLLGGYIESLRHPQDRPSGQMPTRQFSDVTLRRDGRRALNRQRERFGNQSAALSKRRR
ncbi:MAG: hypothetical protein RBT63_07855 [Bdellovibrionales bacterium]|jgi:hypothetical protein|nr:hypothetical protein [Bdellovibrionales bacterium]